MKKIIVTILCIALAFSFCACNASSKQNDIIGVWMLDEKFSPSGLRIPQRIEFFSDSKLQADCGGTYTCTGSKLNIYYSATDSYTYIFKIKNDSLTLKSTGNEDFDNKEYVFYREINNDNSESINDNIIESSSLAESCDYLLSSGKNSNGDIYELVACESSSFEGTDKIGVIKNGKWLVEPTTDCPFIQDGVILSFEDYKSKLQSGIEPYIDWAEHAYLFINDTCFCVATEDGYSMGDFFYNVIWNVETNQSFNSDGYGYGFNILWHYDKSTDVYTVLGEHDNNILIKTINDGNINILDTKTMTVKVIDGKNDASSIAPISEGLFYAVRFNENKNEKGFYDATGNLVIDLSKYYWITPELDGLKNSPHFFNGKCIFEAKNEAGKKFKITIDKTGKVLSETLI